jgi:rhodanese-related sulfurtransferase
MKYIIALIFLIFVVSNCTGQVKSGTYRTMLKKLLSHTVPETTVEEAKFKKEAVFLDAREPKEYAVSHIEGSTHVGYDHFDLSKIPVMPKDTPIIVYCSVGYRSEKVAEQLIAAGYSKVSNLYGGIFEWVNEEQPVYDTQGQTSKVHAYNKAWGVWLNKGKKVY